ncbi:hypothetical protein BaRGS_00012795 [Batillaria attramentaria]|uniref:Uncharacterized protein n=1 Tax=Batillaria attramentaria TaxID=370345 RepID=A0ABD0L961_9CAEN
MFFLGSEGVGLETMIPAYCSYCTTCNRLLQTCSENAANVLHTETGRHGTVVLPGVQLLSNQESVLNHLSREQLSIKTEYTDNGVGPRNQSSQRITSFWRRLIASISEGEGCRYNLGSALSLSLSVSHANNYTHMARVVSGVTAGYKSLSPPGSVGDAAQGSQTLVCPQFDRSTVQSGQLSQCPGGDRDTMIISSVSPDHRILQSTHPTNLQFCLPVDSPLSRDGYRSLN